MKAEIKAEQLYQLIEKQRELIAIQGMTISYFRKYSGESERITRFMDSIHKTQSELAELEKEPTAMEMIKEVFEPIQLPENEVVNQALELASKKAGKEKEEKYADTDADGYVFCGKCGKMR